MRIDLERDTLVSLMKKLEDLDVESSSLNRDIITELDKAELNDSQRQVKKSIYKILKNTLKAIKSGDITINGNKVENKELPKLESLIDYEDLINIYNPVKIKSAKELSSFFIDIDALDVDRVNDTLGTRYCFINKGSDYFYFNPKTNLLTIYYPLMMIGEEVKDIYTLGKDFDAVSYKADKGIYLFKKNDDKTYYGVASIREAPSLEFYKRG